MVIFPFSLTSLQSVKNISISQTLFRVNFTTQGANAIMVSSKIKKMSEHKSSYKFISQKSNLIFWIYKLIRPILNRPSDLRQHAISQLIVATKGPRFESRLALWYRLLRVRNGLSQSCPRATQQGCVKCRRHFTIPAVPTE